MTSTEKKQPPLTPLQQKRYARDGFLVLNNFIDLAVCQLLIDQANNIVRDFDIEAHRTIFSTTSEKHTRDQYFLDSGNDVRCFLEENSLDSQGTLLTEKSFAVNKIGHALHKNDPLFNLFSHQMKISRLAHALGLGEITIVQSMYIFKQPRIGGEVVCHQDSTYLYTEGEPVTGFWFALEDATIENGCLWVIPGGQSQPLRRRMTRDNHENIHFNVLNQEPFAEEKLIPVEVKAGSLVVLHGLLPHMSRENLSSKSRHAYTLHVLSEKSHFAENNWLRIG